MSELLVEVGGVKIWTKYGGGYVYFESDLSICNDGSGPAHGDPYHQAMTAYYSGGMEGGEYLNADVDKYIVVPPQVRAQLPGVVMGCLGRLTNKETGAWHAAITGEIGPDYTTGEAAYCLAKKVNPGVSYNCGDDKRIYLYELWPGIPAVVDNFTYELQPA